MHHDIRYDLTDIPRSDAKAIDDVQFYLGDEFDKVIGKLVEFDGCTPQDIHMALEFVGIRGYPVKAIIRTYLPKTCAIMENEDAET